MKKLYLLLITFILIGCSGSKRYQEDAFTDIYRYDSPSVRVLLSSSEHTMSYTVNTEIVLNVDKKKTALLKKGNKITFTAEGSVIQSRIGTKVFLGSSITLVPSKKETYLGFGNLPYRGYFEIRSNDQKVFLINRLSIEDYLKGVLPVEMGVKNNPDYFEALKAFAIAARTFTLKKVGSKSSLFDFYPDTRDQVYKGMKFETSDDRLAVDKTKGLVLKHNTTLATIFYHSTCGGVLEDAGNIFTFSSNIPYLNSKNDGNPPNCSISPAFSWVEEYETMEIEKLLLNSNLISEKERVKDVSIKNKFPSGRVSELIINFKNNSSLLINAKEIRNLFRRKENGGILRSLLFDIEPIFNNGNLLKVILTGKGNGHGVGLCQWGAMGLSKKGRDYREILHLYFPSTEIVKEYD